jgi:hypothetical protein
MQIGRQTSRPFLVYAEVSPKKYEDAAKVRGDSSLAIDAST